MATMAMAVPEPLNAEISTPAGAPVLATSRDEAQKHR